MSTNFTTSTTLKTHKETPLTLLSESRLERFLKTIAPTLNSVRLENKLLTLNFTTSTIILPLTSTMTWGQLTNSLKEKGLIHESN
jgi:hypothetical protein